jgi:hypothetical protein
MGLIMCCVVRLWPRVKSNAGSPDVERCEHVKSQATTVYFRLGKLRRVSTYVQHVWGIIGHMTAEAGNTEGTDGAPPQKCKKFAKNCNFRILSEGYFIILEISIYGLVLLQLASKAKIYVRTKALNRRPPRDLT